jgi:hypothetical protein
MLCSDAGVLYAMHANIFVSINLSAQLTKLTKRIFNSPVLCEDLAESCIKARIEPKNVVRSVPTHWNLIAEMLSRSLWVLPGVFQL